MLEAVEDLCNRICALVALQKVEKRLQLAPSSASLLKRSEEGPEGGSFAIARGSGVGFIHVALTPRGQLGRGSSEP